MQKNAVYPFLIKGYSNEKLLYTFAFGYFKPKIDIFQKRYTAMKKLLYTAFFGYFKPNFKITLSILTKKVYSNEKIAVYRFFLLF